MIIIVNAVQVVMTGMLQNVTVLSIVFASCTRTPINTCKYMYLNYYTLNKRKD